MSERPDASLDLVFHPDLEKRITQLIEILDLLGLDAEGHSFASYSRAIDKLSIDHLTQQQCLLSLKEIEDGLRKALYEMEHENALMERWMSAIESEAAPSSSRREQVKAKAKEYLRELSDLPPIQPPAVSICDVQTQEEALHERKKRVREKRDKVKAFQGVPPNLEAARERLRNAQTKQAELVKLRERLMNQMTSGVA